MQGSVLDKVTSDKKRKEAYQHPTTLQPHSSPFQSDLRGESNVPGVLCQVRLQRRSACRLLLILVQHKHYLSI